MKIRAKVEASESHAAFIRDYTIQFTEERPQMFYDNEVEPADTGEKKVPIHVIGGTVSFKILSGPAVVRNNEIYATGPGLVKFQAAFGERVADDMLWVLPRTGDFRISHSGPSRAAELLGRMDGPYILERSVDLQQWEEIAAKPPGVIQLDVQPPEGSNEFFRVRPWDDFRR